ncbi:TRPT1-like protein [Mya arenaria]|uniref:2'-phosphotransferase n=1 Tax=Mya arenaria TaxID=6604 RepID=A0ABY7FEQ7_MYAAR|nr:TRPT1-like protein [Mya arenaria]
MSGQRGRGNGNYQGQGGHQNQGGCWQNDGYNNYNDSQGYGYKHRGRGQFPPPLMSPSIHMARGRGVNTGWGGPAPPVNNPQELEFRRPNNPPIHGQDQRKISGPWDGQGNNELGNRSTGNQQQGQGNGNDVHRPRSQERKETHDSQRSSSKDGQNHRSRSGDRRPYIQSLSRSSGSSSQDSWQKGQQPGTQGSSHRKARNDDDLFFLSKTLSSILRHNAEKFGLELMKGGFLYVDDIFRKVYKLRSYTLEDIQHVVKSNDKQRFALEQDDNGHWKIRANQGHKGIPFFRSANNVILSPGNKDGIIYPCYFQGVKDRAQGFRIPFDAKIGLGIREDPAKTGEGKAGKKKGKSNKRQSDDMASASEGTKSDETKKQKSTKSTESPKNTQKETRYNKEEPKNVQSTSDTQPSNEIGHENSPTNDDESSTMVKDNDMQPDVQTKSEDVPVPPAEVKANDIQPDTVAKSQDVTVTPTTVKADVQSDIQTNRQDVTITPSASQIPAEKLVWNEPALIDEAVKSQKFVKEVLLEGSHPSHMVVVCCGEKLGNEDSMVRLIAVFVQPRIIVYPLYDDNKGIVKDGELDKLLNTKDITKVFHNIREVSMSLMMEFDVLLEGTPIWDIKMITDSATLPDIDYERLKETYNYKPKMMKKWATENETIGKQLDGPDVPAEVMKSIIERGKLIDDLYRVSESKLKAEQKKAIKKKVYAAIKPEEKQKTLLEKFEKLKTERKEKEKAKKLETPPEKAPTKQKQPQQPGKGKGKGKNKK